MVAWLVTLTIVLVTLVFCALLILVAILIKGSEEESEEEQKQDKCIQVHESQARLKHTTIVKSVNLSTQEECDLRKNRVDVTCETYYSVQTHLSKYQLDQYPWWSYMFMVVGGFMVCMFLNYVVNRVNAARFDRYEQLHHANDPDKPCEETLKIRTENPKKSKSHNEVKEITLVFTQDENQRRGKEAACSENVLVKPTASGYSFLSIGNSQMINQTTRKPIQIKDSLILGSATEKLLERELTDHGVETESVDLDLEGEPGDIESGPVYKTIEREPAHQTIARQPVHLNVERERVHLTVESEPYLPIEREPVDKTIERQPVPQTIERQSVHQTIQRQPVPQTVESEPYLPIEREPVHKTIERQPVNRTIERQPVHQTVESEPVHLPIEREPFDLSIETELLHLPIEKEAVHLPNERESECLTVERESVHLLVERLSVHLPIEREPVNVLVEQVEIKNIKLSASMPTLSNSEIIHEVTSYVRHYASDLSLSSCNEEKAENKHG